MPAIRYLAGSIESIRVLVVEGEPSAHRAAPPSWSAISASASAGAGALDAARLADDVGRVLGGPGEDRAA
jgi:hypothetical protein